MFIGIICACIPSAAYAVRHPDAIYQRLWRKLAPHGLLRSKAAGTASPTATQQLTQHQPEQNMEKSTDRKYRQMFNISAMETQDSHHTTSIRSTSDASMV
jgi:hypothetical protein